MDTNFPYIMTVAAGLVLLVIIARRPHMGIVFMVCMLPLESFAVLPGALRNFTSITSLFGLAALFFSFASNKRLVAEAKVTDKSLYGFGGLLLMTILIGDMLKPISTGFSYPLTYIQLLLLMWLCEQIFRTREQIETLMKFFIAANLVAALVSAIGFSAEVASSEGEVSRLAGLQGGANEFAIYISIAIVMTFYYLITTSNKVTRLLLVLILAAFAFLIFLSGSRGAALFLALVIVWLLLQFRRNQVAVMVFSLIVLFVVLVALAPYVPSAYFQRIVNIPQVIIYGEDTVGLRQMLWGYGLKLWSESPVLGIGSGIFQIYSTSAFRLPHMLPLHSTYLTYLVENGIIGLFLFLMILLRATLNYVRVVRSAGKSSKLGLLAIAWQAILLLILLNGIKGDWNTSKMLWLTFSFSLVLTGLQKATTDIQAVPERVLKAYRPREPYYRPG